MDIISIELENYRGYRGKQKISLGLSAKNKNLNILTARNAVGKSTLFNAISWCLFGTEDHLANKEDGRVEPIINTDVLKASNGAECSAKVILELSSPEKQIIVERSIFGKTIEEGNAGVRYKKLKCAYSEVGPKSRDSSWHRLEDSDAELFILQHILDSEIRRFFLIDGERLRGFFVEGSGKAIRDSVLKVTDIQYIQETRKKVDQLARDVSKKLGAGDPGLELIEEELSQYQSALEGAKSREKELKSQLSEAKKNMAELGIKIQNSKNDEYTKLVKKLKDVDLAIENSNNRIDDIGLQIDQNILRNAFAYLLRSEYEASIKIIDLCEEKGLIPSYLSDPLMQHIMEKRLCICGTKIHTASSEEKCIKEYFESSKYSKLKGIPLEGKGILLGYLDKADEYAKTRDRLLKELNSSEQFYVENQKEKENIQNALSKIGKGYDEEEIYKLEHRRKSLDDAIQGANREIGKCSMLQTEYAKNIGKAMEKRDEAIKKSKTTSALRLYDKICKESQSILAILETKVEEELRKELEEKIKKRFFDVGTGEVTDEIGSITLNEDFDIDVRKKNGYPCINNMSAGQSLVFTLAFATALRSMSRYEFPLIIDTPIAKLDPGNEKAILSIPETYSDVQLTLLLILEREYTEKVRESVEKIKNKEYLLTKSGKGVLITDISKKDWSEIIKFAMA